MRRSERLHGLTPPVQRVRVGVVTRNDHQWPYFPNEWHLCIMRCACHYDNRTARYT